MVTRRDMIMGGLATTALSSCSVRMEPRQLNPRGLPAVPVDIHNHIFNATDIPIAGFAEQVFLRDPETPVPGGDSVARSLIQLVVDIVLAARGTPTAAEELDDLAGLSRLPERSGGDLLQQDRRAVEAGLRVLENKVNTAGARRDALRTLNNKNIAPNGDEELFSRLAAETGVGTNPVGPFGNVLRNEQERGSRARAIANAVYRDDRYFETGTFKSLAERDAPDQSLLQNLRWAGLLTRSRVDILGELIRLYAHQSSIPADEPLLSSGIKIFSPSLVDFTYWLGAANDRDEDRSGAEILEQIALLSRIASLERGALLLPFAPFCPLRAAVYRKNGHGNWLEKMTEAVGTQGFAGIKLYPPMGFLPLGNEKFDMPGERRPRALADFGILGSELDAELMALYDWCANEDVPIKSHGNNSLGADACTGQNASAENWRSVLETSKWRSLRLNIAHFGGFDEVRFEPDQGCPIPQESYEAQAVDLIGEFDNLYVDFGYWTDVTGSNRTSPDNGQPTAGNVEVRRRMQEQLNRQPKLKDRLMYGSDWSMIGREEQHARYYDDVRNALGALDLLDEEQGAILGANALRYLGLTRRGKQFRRLKIFFEDAPQFAAVTSVIRPSFAFALFGEVP